MKIHEYQAKDILKKYDIPIQDGIIIDKIEDASSAIKDVAKQYNTTDFVIKAQIHAGGRGKGGGVKYCKDSADALESCKNILGMNLTTHQTSSSGQLVRKIMVGEAINIDKEYYVAITLDRSKGKDVFMVSSEGGVEIEKVAKESPEKIVKEWIEPGFGLKGFQAFRLAKALGLEGVQLKSTIGIFKKLYKAYIDIDASIVEINPMVLTREGDILALDAKMNFDDNALYRQKDIAEMRDEFEEDPTEVEAGKFDLNYIKLDGNVGCMVNGAGLAMATMDIIKQKGGEPANFLDVGGNASIETVKNGFKIILSDSSVKAVLINIFGGIVRCDRIANGIIEALKELDLKVPVVVRLDGTNSEEAKEILSKSNVSIIPADSFADAAEKVVNAGAA